MGYDVALLIGAMQGGTSFVRAEKMYFEVIGQSNECGSRSGSYMFSMYSNSSTQCTQYHSCEHVHICTYHIIPESCTR